MNRNIRLSLKSLGMILVIFLVSFSFIGCQKEEPDGIKIQKSNDGISISGKYGDKSIDIEKSNSLNKGISVNGKSGDSSFNFDNSNSLKNRSIDNTPDYVYKIRTLIVILAVFVVPILIGFIIESSSRKKNNKTIIQGSTVSVEKNEEIRYENEAYNKKLSEDRIICDYKEKLSELNKIYNLYKNEIYNEQEFKMKKENWIESLKLFDFSKAETDFLNEIIPIVNEKILENRELKLIKYIISGEYAKDKYREEQEQKIKVEEEARRKREEIISNIKGTTKEITISTISKTANTVNEIKSIVSNNFNKRVAPDNKFVCECGYEIEKEDAFCANCGKKLK